MSKSKSKDEVQSEALIALQGKINASVAVSMGVGKTLIGIKHMNSHFQLFGSGKYLVVAPKKAIIQSWKDELEKHGYSYLISHIKFITYLSLSKHVHDSDYSIVYLDECHNLLMRHTNNLAKQNGIIIGLTGTPPKIASSEKGLMVQQFCPVVYNYFIDDAIEDGILNDYEIIVHKIPLSRYRNFIVKGKTRSWPSSEVENYAYWCNELEKINSPNRAQMVRIQRMRALMSYPSKAEYAKKLLEGTTNKCIVFANTQDQADSLCKYSYHAGNSNSEENLLKFKAGIINKLSAVLQLNEGVNIPNLKEGIILHAYGNERKASQRIGRMLRLNPDEKAIVHILCYEKTIDEHWVKMALEAFDSSKIKYLL
jgi:superfamily II DNA or RNA helicase